MEINPASTQPSFRSGSDTTQPSRTAISSDFETFLRLLTTQIQNQDPLSPTPSDEFAVQLATFSGVEQQVRTNEMLAALGTQFATMGMAQFAGWVGLEARAPVPVAFRGQPITLSPNPAFGADSAQLVVRDGLGREVDRIEVPVSAEPLEWAGVGPNGYPLPQGNYSFELVSLADGDVMGVTPVDVYARVTEVRGTGGQTVIVFDGGASIAASEVTALRQP